MPQEGWLCPDSVGTNAYGCSAGREEPLQPSKQPRFRGLGRADKGDEALLGVGVLGAHGSAGGLELLGCGDQDLLRVSPSARICSPSHDAVCGEGMRAVMDLGTDSEPDWALPAETAKRGGH